MEDTPNDPPSAIRWTSARWAVGLLVALVGALVVFSHDEAFGWVAARREALGPWAAVLFGLAFGGLLLATGPVSLMGFLAGALFGLGVGTATALGADLVASAIAYGFARLMGGRAAAAFAERQRWFGALRDDLANDRKLVLALRLNPFVPVAVSSYALGLARTRIRLVLLALLASAPLLLLVSGAGVMARLALGEGSRWWGWVLLGAGAAGAVAVMARATRTLDRAVGDARPRAAGGPFAATPAQGDGAVRVGVELETAGVSVEECARVVAERFGGEVELLHEGEAVVDGELGTFRVELDSRPVKRLTAALAEVDDGPDDRDIAAHLDELKNRVLLGLAEPFVPVEIVTPPLPTDRIADLDALVDTLRRRGARGTHDRVFYAFGVHFNPEAESTEVGSILAHMRAFFLLRDWIRRAGDTDLARQVTPHIEPHPDELVERFMDPSYQPTLEELIDDYLRLSPTRNRDLDMLPLFAHLDEERVRAVLPDEKINPRPTYHYRLPNSRIGDPEWRLSDEWQSWRLVEQLARDPERLAAWTADWIAHRERALGELLEPWADEVGRRLRS